MLSCIGLSDNQSFYVTRSIGCFLVIGVVSTVAALFFRDIIPLNSPIASLVCGSIVVSLNLLPLGYFLYLLLRKDPVQLEESQSTPNIPEPTESLQDISEDLRQNVLCRNLQ